MSTKSMPLIITMDYKEALTSLLFLLVIFTHRVTPSTIPIQIRAEQKSEPWEAPSPVLAGQECAPGALFGWATLNYL